MLRAFANCLVRGHICNILQQPESQSAVVTVVVKILILSQAG
jgi:hypothetical protein